MIDLGHEIAAAVRVDWNDERLDVARAGLHLRRRRRTFVHGVASTVLAAALVTLTWLAWPEHAQPRAPGAAPLAQASVAPEPAPTPGQVRFDDGSTATTLGAASELHAKTTAPGRTVVELTRGAARFEVTEDRARVFRVESGRATVESFGAVFGCERHELDTHVEVIRGTVRVMWDDQQRELGAGEHGEFPPAAASPPPPAAHELRTAPSSRPPPPHPTTVPDGWRELANAGEFDRAYTALETSTVRDEPEELLLAADVKRLSHHPAEAVDPLRAVVRDHANDPRAALAAFTLGRVLLDELGRPAEAAAAFADAVRLAPAGPMAEDAIAREVEAWSRAGDAATAKQLAEQYLTRFPHGRKVKSVRRFGAIE